jgi:hypothetical protein
LALRESGRSILRQPHRHIVHEPRVVALGEPLCLGADRAPPAAPETQFYTNPTYFDTIGRTFRRGARFQF